jgi:predicted dithiol-disulfide oxidoreductase (DUF899 family)
VGSLHDERFPGESGEYRKSQGLGFEGPCPSCTSIIDGIDGELPHIAQRLNFAVAAKGPAERLRSHAQSRGWRHARLLSSVNSTYNVDYKAEVDARSHARRSRGHGPGAALQLTGATCPRREA